MKLTAPLATVAALLSIGLFGHVSSALAFTCGGRYHTISSGKVALFIVREHDVSCRTATRLGLFLLQRATIGPHRAAHVDRFTCRYVRGNAAEVRCTASRRRSVLFTSE